MPKLPRDGLDLSFFLTKAKVIQLYRDFLRSVQLIQKDSRRDATRLVRSRFEENRHVKDPKLIKDCMAIGGHQLSVLRRQVGFASANLTTAKMDDAWGAAFKDQPADEKLAGTSVPVANISNESGMGEGWPWARE